MKIFPFKKELCLPNTYLKEYNKNMLFFAWELRKFRTNKYIIEKIRDFPFHLFGDSDGNEFFSAVVNTFFEMCLILAFKLSNDTSKGAYTIKKLRNELAKHIKKEYLKQFNSHLKEINFNKKLNVIDRKVRNLRNKALAHIDKSYAKGKLNLERISWTDFNIIENNLIDTFNGLSLNSEWMLLPISYDTRVRHPIDIDSRPDIIKILDFIAKESNFLNFPEGNPIGWKFEMEKISKEDLELFNYYRRKNNLKEYVLQG